MPRFRYQIRCECRSRSRAVTRPSADGAQRAVLGDESRRQAAGLEPRRRRARRGRARPCSRCSPATQSAAATDAVRHVPSTGRPVRGSSRWWTFRPPRCQRRCVVVEVARPPRSSPTTCAAACVGPSATATCQACRAFAGRADRDVAAQAHDAVDADLRRETCGEEVRRVRLADGAEVDDDPRRHPDRAVGVHADLLPRVRACGYRDRRRPVTSLQLGVVAVVPEGLQRAPDGGIHEPLGLARGVQRRPQRRHRERAAPGPTSPPPRSPGRGRSRAGTGCTRGPPRRAAPRPPGGHRRARPARRRRSGRTCRARTTGRRRTGRRLSGSGCHEPVDDTGGVKSIVGGGDVGFGSELGGRGAELVGAGRLGASACSSSGSGPRSRSRARPTGWTERGRGRAGRRRSRGGRGDRRRRRALVTAAASALDGVPVERGVGRGAVDVRRPRAVRRRRRRARPRPPRPAARPPSGPSPARLRPPRRPSPRLPTR